MSNVITYFLTREMSTGDRTNLWLSAWSQYLEMCDRIKEILSLDIVCLKAHMSGDRLCGKVGLGKRGSLLLITQVHIKLPKSEQK